MKLTKQSYELLEQEIPVRKMDDYDGSHFREQYIDNMYKHIERCGKVCYRSEHTIKEGSAEKFINRLIKSGHLSVLEHAVVYLAIPYSAIDEKASSISSIGPISKGVKYYSNEYSRVRPNPRTSCHCVSTNYRVIIQNGWEDDLQYLCEPTEYHEKRHTVLLHSCIHVYKDLTRHRKVSFSIESTRFCNYSQYKFGGELKFVKLPWVNYDEWSNWNDPPTEANLLYDSLLRTERNYNNFISLGWKPQQAAEILPQCTAADVVMTAYDSDWSFIFDLRALDKTGPAHPLVKELMIPLYNEFKEKGWIK